MNIDTPIANKATICAIQCGLPYNYHSGLIKTVYADLCLIQLTDFIFTGVVIGMQTGTNLLCLSNDFHMLDQTL